MRCIPIPNRMAHLKVDPRGFAIPYGVVTDQDGVVHFAINDEVVRRRSILDDLCSICGKALLRGRWFVGGPLSAFHPRGAFIDPPMHSECAHYALQACPYLAAPRYAKDVGSVKAKAAAGRLSALTWFDPTMIPGRPRDDLFIALCATRQEVFETFNMRPVRPYVTVEYWRHGAMLERLTGNAMRARIIEEARLGLLERAI